MPTSLKILFMSYSKIHVSFLDSSINSVDLYSPIKFFVSGLFFNLTVCCLDNYELVSRNEFAKEIGVHRRSKMLS